jgi:Transcriptional regulator
MDLKSLMLLVDILDAGNLSEAGRRLKMTRANVSYHLNQLEKVVGMQLVRRTTRRVEPTELGLKLYQHGRNLRDELAAAQESIESLGKLPQGKVRLSAPSGYGKYVVTPWLIEFKRRYPDIVMDVLFENTVDDLLRDEVDIAVRILPTPPQNLVARQLGRIRYLACASPHYVAQHGLPAQPSDLSEVPLISANVAGKNLRLSAYRNGHREVVPLQPSVISRNFPFLRDATLSGLGVGLLPEYMLREDFADGRLVRALEQWDLSIFGSNVYMLYMPNRHHPRALSMLMDHITTKAQGYHR